MKKITIAVIIILIMLSNSYFSKMLGMPESEKLNLISPNILVMILNIVNFLILVWFLNKFLFGPVIDIMEKRESTIRNNLAKAENDKEEAVKLVEEHKSELLKLKKEQKKIVSEALVEGDELKRKMLEETKKEIENIRKENILELEREKEKVFSEIKKDVGNIVIKTTEKILRKEVDSNVNNEYIEDLLAEIERK